MHEPIPEREAIWNEFLAQWQIEKLRSMRLDQYTKAGDRECFTNWLESRTGSLGSIWGGSSFKFGIYSRKDKQPRENAEGVIYGTDYAWLEKYGATPDQAFERVRSLVVSVAEASARGDLDAIEPIDLGPATKWKIAFLYQNRSAPQILDIYKVEHLRTLAAVGKEVLAAQLHRRLSADLNGQHILTRGDELWSKIEALEAAKLKTAAAYEFLQRTSALAPIKPATKKMAGFATPTGRQLALALDNQTPTLYLSPGDWLQEAKPSLATVYRYGPQESRSSNLAANAPGLAVPNPAVRVTVETLAGLTDLIDAYTGIPQTEAQTEKPRDTPEQRPLNQILYGAPGTGKTYETVNEAVRIADPGRGRTLWPPLKPMASSLKGWTRAAAQPSKSSRTC